MPVSKGQWPALPATELQYWSVSSATIPYQMEIEAFYARGACCINGAAEEICGAAARRRRRHAALLPKAPQNIRGQALRAVAGGSC